jgi:hypothetical protein
MNIFLLLGAIGGVIVAGGGLALWGMKGGRPPSEPRMMQKSRPMSRPPPEDIAARKEAADKIAGEVVKEAAKKKAGTKVAEEAGTKVGAKVAEEASKSAMTKAAGAVPGAGLAGAVSKKQKELFCPNCREKDSKFCSKCGRSL